MSNPLAPFQNAFYISINFSCILYGVELVLYFMTFRAMLSRERERVPADKYFMLFSTVLLLLNTIYIATQAVFGEEMWIVNANYPGGTDAYFSQFALVWYQTLGTAAPIVSRFLSDGLLVYRCYVVWDDTRIVLLLTLVYLATLSLGIVQLYESGRPNADQFASLTNKIAIGYISCTVGFEAIATSLIAARIYFAGKKFGQVLGAEVGRTYTGAAAIMVESMLLSTLTGVIYLVSFALKSQVDIFFCLYIAVHCSAIGGVSRHRWSRVDKTQISNV